ncbi:MAG: isopeptide-forming domain-containing fimbrial protein [Ruminococcus sp.]|nr:isopeptide-forming domain-containing fimbrial protein [Ruminococcus sp.]
MKSIFKKSMAVTIVVFMLILTAIPFASAATLLDESKKVSFKVNCDKPGYTFEVYEVAKLKNGNSPSFETAYEPLFDGIADEVKSGKTKDILHKLDSLSPALSAMPATAISVGIFNSDDKTKTYSNLEQGIYYVKCTGFPAGVKSVENSVVVLPYFQNNNWIYTISPINLATKVADDTPATEKEITNSTKNNKNFTDVSIGDTVDFALYNSTAGSSSMKLTTYAVYDKMSKGLTFDKNSVKVFLADKDKKTLSAVADTNYKLNITSQMDGQDTEFNVALTKPYLAGEDFYDSTVEYVLVTYSAVLNKHAVVGIEGNPNEDVELKYGNDSHVDSVPGNEVFVYTYGIGVTKLNEDGKALAGAKFGLYKTEADASNKEHAIAVGTSDTNGKVVFLNGSNEEMKVQSGNYFIAELEAPEGYNVYGKEIPISVEVSYLDAFTNNTWVENAPKDGFAAVTVTDTKLIVPQTGGYVQYVYLAGVLSLIIGGAMFLVSRRIKNR